MATEADLIIQAGQNVTNAAIARTESHQKSNAAAAQQRSDAQSLIVDGLASLSDTIGDIRETEAKEIEQQQLFDTQLITTAIDNVQDPDTLQKFDIAGMAEKLNIKNFSMDSYAKAEAAKQKQFSDIVQKEQKVDAFNTIQDKRTTDDIWRQFKELNGHLSPKQQKAGIGSFMTELRKANPGREFPEDLDFSIANRVQALDRAKAQMTLTEYNELQQKAWDAQGDLRIANAAYKNAEVDYKTLKGDQILEPISNDYSQRIGESMFVLDKDGNKRLSPKLDTVVDYSDMWGDDKKPMPYAEEQVIRHMGEINKATRKFFPNGRASRKFAEMALQPLREKVNSGKATAREKANLQMLTESLQDPRNLPVLNERMANTIFTHENFYKEKKGMFGFDWGWMDIDRVDSKTYEEKVGKLFTDPTSDLNTPFLLNWLDQVSAKSARNRMQLHTNAIGNHENLLLDLGFGTDGKDLGNRAANTKTVRQ